MKRNWRWLVIIVSLFIILFIGRFTKGIDIAGGVEFVYKVDFTKYREIYTNLNDFNSVTTKAKQIIEANIRKRVNGLGVGDAEVKLQKTEGDDYVVVRIGGLDDLDKAREIIGKTVELEFALPNSETGSVNKAERKKLAETLMGQIIKNPSNIKSIGDQGSNDVYYFNVTGAAKSSLPPALVPYTEEISALQSGQVLGKVVEGMMQAAQSASGGDVSGFFIVKSLGKVVGAQGQLSDQELTSKAQAKGFNVSDLFSFNRPKTTGELISAGVYYNAGSKQIIFDLDNQFSGRAAYRLDVFVPIDTGAVTGLDKLTMDTDVEKLGLVKYVDNRWASSAELPFLNNVSGLNVNTVKTILASPGQPVVVKIYEVKNVNVILNRNITLSNVATKSVATSFVADLLNNDLYNLELVFVRDTNTWLPAKDSQNRVLNGAYFKFASVTRDQLGKPSVQVDLDEVGKDIFCKITEANIQKQMGIFVGGVLVTAPTIQSKICGGSAIINGDYDIASAKLLADNLNEGALPAKLIQVNESKVSATLGEHAWQGALWATIVSLIAIFALMVWRYDLRKAFIGMVGVLSFIIVLVALLKIMGYALSLSGMAAIILNIGMGVDASILIFERLKEEKALGRREDEAIYIAYERAWPAVFGGQMSTIAIGILLLFLGSDLFQGFGLVMTLNIAILLAVSVPLIKELLLKTGKK